MCSQPCLSQQTGCGYVCKKRTQKQTKPTAPFPCLIFPPPHHVTPSVCPFSCAGVMQRGEVNGGVNASHERMSWKMQAMEGKPVASSPATGSPAAGGPRHAASVIDNMLGNRCKAQGPVWRPGMGPVCTSMEPVVRKLGACVCKHGTCVWQAVHQHGTQECKHGTCVHQEACVCQHGACRVQAGDL